MNKVSSSKPKAKPSVNEQVKAGLAALKDLLGAHAEREGEQQEITNEGQAATAAENAAAQPVTMQTGKTGETGAESSAQANTSDAPGGETAHRETNHDEEQAGENDAPEEHSPSNAELNSTTENTSSTMTPATESSSGTTEQESVAQQSINQASFEDAVETLRAAGSSDDRVAAARSIAELGSQRATPHLIAAMFDDDPKVRSAAEEALANIGEPLFEQPTTPKNKAENLTMTQSPSNAPERSDSSTATARVDQAQADRKSVV